MWEFCFVFSAGVPEYNIPSIEPLLLANFSFTTIGINFASEDAQLYGLSKFYANKFRQVFTATPPRFYSRFLVFRADTADQNFELDIEVPRLRISSNYSVFGKFLILNINETDSMETNFGDR